MPVLDLLRVVLVLNEGAVSSFDVVLNREAITPQNGIPAAWTTTWGSGRPVIALGSDIDDLSRMSQMPGVAWHEPMVAGAPGYGEGTTP